MIVSFSDYRAKLSLQSTLEKELVALSQKDLHPAIKRTVEKGLSQSLQKIQHELDQFEEIHSAWKLRKITHGTVILMAIQGLLDGEQPPPLPEELKETAREIHKDLGESIMAALEQMDKANKDLSKFSEN